MKYALVLASYMVLGKLLTPVSLSLLPYRKGVIVPTSEGHCQD